MSFRHLFRAATNTTRSYARSSTSTPPHSPTPPPRNPHAEWYAQVLPSMFPIALLGSTVYIALNLIQTHLATERHADIAAARIHELEHELNVLRALQNKSPDQEPENPPSVIPRRWWLF